MSKSAKNLWILTEERPKNEVLRQILSKFAKDFEIAGFMDNLRVLPVLDGNKFTFLYELSGFRSNSVDKVYIRTVSGSSSFCDYLVFYQEKMPIPQDMPIYAIEETKTDDSESRNTGVYQRCSKFVFLDYYYPKTKKVMLYNLKIEQKTTPTETNIFGTRMLLTLGVEILGKQLDPETSTPFLSVDELIAYKGAMRRPPAGNVPITITKFFDRIEVSGRLYKSGGLSHDPNIGALSIICASLRKLGWDKDLIITQHGLSQGHANGRNKFILIANKIGIKLAGLSVPVATMKDDYWHYDVSGEKLGTIFIHIVVESFTRGYSIFENHAGSEKGYFIKANGDHIPLAKYSNRDEYKAGDKSKIIYIPDLILIDFDKSEIINVEGKKYQFRQNGINELANYDYIEEHYIKKNYPEFTIVRTVVLYGSHENHIVEIEVGFLLNEDGNLILGIKAPRLFVEAIKNLLDFWK
jgi:hypothetical protein